eukprot:scaffold41711_cov197-Isochrysis_galbana.AAC.1
MAYGRRSLPDASFPGSAGAQNRIRPSAPPDRMPPSAAASAVTATPACASLEDEDASTTAADEDETVRRAGGRREGAPAKRDARQRLGQLPLRAADAAQLRPQRPRELWAVGSGCSSQPSLRARRLLLGRREGPELGLGRQPDRDQGEAPPWRCARRQSQLVDPWWPCGQRGRRDQQLSPPPVPDADGVLIVGAHPDEQAALGRKGHRTDGALVEGAICRGGGHGGGVCGGQSCRRELGRGSGSRRVRPAQRRRLAIVGHPADAAELLLALDIPHRQPRRRPGQRRRALPSHRQPAGRVKCHTRDIVVVPFEKGLFRRSRVVHDGQRGGAVEHPAVGQREHVGRPIVTAQPIVAIHKLTAHRHVWREGRARHQARVKVWRHVHARLREAVADGEWDRVAVGRCHVSPPFPAGLTRPERRSRRRLKPHPHPVPGRGSGPSVHRRSGGGAVAAGRPAAAADR